MGNPSTVAFSTQALRTTNVIGLDKLLGKLRTRLAAGDASKPRVVFVTTDAIRHPRGGFGKTRLLEHIASPEHHNQLAGMLDSRILVANQLVDLFHHRNHTALGFALALRQSIDSRDLFREFDKAYESYTRLRRSHKAERLAEAREKTLSAFVENARQISEDQPVVFLVDTAERLRYFKPDLPGQVNHAWAWLTGTLANWGNVILIIAGRPSATELIGQLDSSLGEKHNQLTIEPFDEAQSLAYFDAVTDTLTKANRQTAARNVNQLEPRHRSVAHVLSGGVPILLSLIIDTMSQGGDIPKQLRRKLSDLQVLNKSDMEAVQQAFRGELIDRLTANPDGLPSESLLLTMGRLPHGADAGLVSKLLKISKREATERLEKFKTLSFVKSREGDESIYLHDEMYDMLAERIYAQPDDRADRLAAERLILAYYDERLEAWSDAMNTLFAPAESDAKFADISEKELQRLEQERTRLQTAKLYYQVCADRERGFRLYYRQLREAILSSDTTLDSELESEVASFIENPPRWLQGQIASEFKEQVEGTLAIRELPRAWAEKRYIDGLLIVSEYRRDPKMQRRLKSNPNTRWVVDTYEALCHAYLGTNNDLAQAREIAQRVITEVEAHQRTNVTTSQTIQQWRTKAVLAFAYSTLGHTYYLLGQANEANERLRKAAYLWRDVILKIELARTLNDLGYAQSLSGDHADAIANVQEGLQLRRELGYRAPVALSYNTLALIHMRTGAFEEAQRLSEIALKISLLLDYKTGQGYALTALAEELRRSARSMGSGEKNAEQQVNLLRRSREYAQDALQIFTESQESPRQVDAWIESGCALRDWAQLRKRLPYVAEPWNRLARESNHALQQASELAQNGRIWHRALDAELNRTWLGYYTDQIDIIDDSRDRARRLIDQHLSEYLIDRRTGKPTIDSKQAEHGNWGQIGKYYVALGHREFDAAKSSAGDWSLTAEYYLLGLQYNVFADSQAFGNQNARQQIIDRIRTLSPQQRLAFAVATQHAEEEWSIEIRNSQLRDLLLKRALWAL